MTYHYGDLMFDQQSTCVKLIRGICVVLLSALGSEIFLDSGGVEDGRLGVLPLVNVVWAKPSNIITVIS